MRRAERARLSFSLLAIVALGVPVACGGGTTTSAAPPPTAPTAAGDAGATAPAPNANAPGPLASVFTTDPSALATLLAQAAAAGSAWLGPAAGATPDAAEAGLRAAGAQYAPGLTPEGNVAKATLMEGGHASFSASLDPSKCYAIVAYGSGVTDVDVNLLVPPFYNLLAGQDGMTGAVAVIGASPSFVCPLVALPVPYKIDLYAKRGSGPVAAQLYSKPR